MTNRFFQLDSALSLTNLIRQTNQTTLKRYYFDMMRLSMEPVRLSVYTASRLTPELKAMKRAFAFPLIQFERAPVTLQDYVKYHLFETMSFVLADLSKVREIIIFWTINCLISSKQEKFFMVTLCIENFLCDPFLLANA